ncbi:unnamed protein product [Linum tenue]|uniref:Protein CPR-5 n=1 Tax=Linum tenue TaxID=586396 RepID=A0AAV0RDU2_9ROSI|nr:unnamed protein product [Linum tenue]
MSTLLPAADSSPIIPTPPQQLENDNPIRIKNNKTRTKKKKKNKLFSVDEASSSSSATSSSSSFSSAQRNSGPAGVPRRRKLVVAPLRRSRGDGNRGESLDAVALPLGMSFAAVIVQVLERKDAEGERMMSAELLSAICTTAVRESLANVFGNEFELFANNFHRSFRSTLRTLRVINESSFHKADHNLSHLNSNNLSPDESHSPVSSVHNQLHSAEEKEGQLPTISLTGELTLCGHDNQLTCTPGSFSSRMELSTIERSVMEQSRFNDLKALEIGLSMRRLKLKEEHIALGLDSNRLERSKLAMGVEKASFRAEKFKTQLEDTRHAELLRNCTDCLVAGLFFMSGSLSYGAYVYSYRRIAEATESCTTPFEETKSWWAPKSFSSFNANLHTLKCQVQVVSRMLFGLLMILSVAYLLLQRSTTSQRSTMPITFILLLLGVMCGFAGKLCVDTLGGDGLHWLFFWETICSLHFLANMFTSTVYRVLCGSLDVSTGGSRPCRRIILWPYWFRRVVFYTILLLVLPLCCGLLPFARFLPDSLVMYNIKTSALGMDVGRCGEALAQNMLAALLDEDIIFRAGMRLGDSSYLSWNRSPGGR